MKGGLIPNVFLHFGAVPLVVRAKKRSCKETELRGTVPAIHVAFAKFYKHHAYIPETDVHVLERAVVQFQHGQVSWSVRGLSFNVAYK
jgi:hypothetical protein